VDRLLLGFLLWGLPNALLVSSCITAVIWELVYMPAPAGVTESNMVQQTFNDWCSVLPLLLMHQPTAACRRYACVLPDGRAGVLDGLLR
jgi:hypothetical protein